VDGLDVARRMLCGELEGALIVSRPTARKPARLTLEFCGVIRSWPLEVAPTGPDAVRLAVAAILRGERREP